MSDYISRDELLKIRPFTLLCRLSVSEYDEGFLDCADEAREAIKNLPAADVAPVVHGKWISCFEDWRKQIEGDKCTACGFEHYGTNIKNYNYCPNCGAKMVMKKLEGME